MGVTERDRQKLFAWFEEHMDPERATTMMELMPPAGASELATKADIARLEASVDGLEGRFDRLEDRFDRLEDRFDRLEAAQLALPRTLGTWLFASQAAVIAAVGVFTGMAA